MTKRERTSLLLTTTLGLILTACGGTASTPGAQTPAPTAFSGTLSALNMQAGSATVAGASIRLGQVTVTRNGTPVSPAALSVGQQVDVTTGMLSAQDTTAGSATVDIHTELEGEISAVDSVTGSLTVAGQVVAVDQATQIHLGTDRDDLAGTGTLADLHAGLFVEVGVVDPAADPVVAASIEVKDERERAGDDHDPHARTTHLRGAVSALNTGAHTFALGDVTVDFGAAKLEGPLADGAAVHVQGTYDASTHTLRAAHVEVNGRRKPGEHEGALYGVVAALDSAAHTFMLGPVTIDYSAATVTGSLAAGARVEVVGAVDPTTHVLTATRVVVRGARPADAPGRTLRVEGHLKALDPAAHHFVLRGLTVDYSAATVRGTLSAGAEVRVTGVLGSAPALLSATTVEVEPDEK